MRFKQWAKSPKAWVLIAMAFYLALASYASHDADGMKNAAVAVAVCVILDVLCGLFEERKRILPDGAAITGLILALILSATTPYAIVAAVSAISILSKHLLAYKKKPIFNPAAFGLLASIPLFRTEQSWWGAFGDLPGWFLAPVVLGGYLVANRINKFPQVFTYLGTYFILMYVLGTGALRIGTGFLDAATLSDALRPPFVNAALFFALFMLTDPPTSPAKVPDQIVFGLLSAAVAVLAYGYDGGLMFLYIGLMAGNLYQWAKSRISRTSKPARPPLKKAGKMPV